MNELPQYRVFDEHLVILSEIKKLAFHINIYLKNFMCEYSLQDKMIVRLALFNAPKSRTIMCCPEIGYVDSIEKSSQAYLAFRYVLRVIAFNKKYEHYPLHACCVVGKNKRAVLIAGNSGSGKTSLTAALLQRGFCFAGDDQAYLQQDGRVVSFPVGSSILPNTFVLIPELQALKNKDCKFRGPQGWEWTVNYGDAFSIIPAYTRLEISHLFFVRPNFGQESAVKDCSQDTAMWHFLNHRHIDRKLITPLGFSDPKIYNSSFNIFNVLKRTSKFYEVSNGDLHKTADLIAQTVGM